MRAAENGPRVDRADRGTNDGSASVEQQAPVGTICIVVPDELGEHRPEVRLVEEK